MFGYSVGGGVEYALGFCSANPQRRLGPQQKTFLFPVGAYPRGGRPALTSGSMPPLRSAAVTSRADACAPERADACLGAADALYRARVDPKPVGDLAHAVRASGLV
jgi:hypothetical protein